VQAEQGRQNKHAAVTILNVGWMNDRMQQQTYRVDENVPLLAFDLFAGVVAWRVDRGPPFSALFTLWLSITQAVGPAALSTADPRRRKRIVCETPMSPKPSAQSKNTTGRIGTIVFVWENFGPMHADRCDAVGSYFRGRYEVVGIELAERSAAYDWESESGKSFHKHTIFRGTAVNRIPLMSRIYLTLKECIRHRRAIYFLCHYEHPATLTVAIVLRCLGFRVFVMNNSKFDDYQRFLWREVVKSFFYFPYSGALTSGTRPSEYLRFLGIPEHRVHTGYNTISLARIRRLSRAPLAPGGTAFHDRHFTIVARFVPKKNLHMALEAYAAFLAASPIRRKLHLCGSGPLEKELKQKVFDLNLTDDVIFHGFVQTEQVCQILADTLALLLPSIEEQFGNVVIEAQALNVPVIVSENCGARDELVRSGVNGFVIEPDNPAGLTFFMSLISKDEQLWRRMCCAAPQYASKGDVMEFTLAVERLIEG
jgi:glycosyltransferase involved in cell wall biosynthesis